MLLPHLQQHLEGAFLPSLGHGLNAIVQALAGIDQRLDVKSVTMKQRLGDSASASKIAQ
jgi:hypothetical protein